MINQKVALHGLVVSGLGLGFATGELEPLTVIAKKFDSPESETTSAIDVLTAADLERIQKHRLIDGLSLVPGVQGLSTAGQTGNLGTVIMRGLSTKYMQVVVDGVRLTGATNGANNFLGNAQLFGISQLEVLRGPQSVLYGTGAAGGVVGYETALGKGDGETSLTAEVGNFGTFRSILLTEGSAGNLSYAVGAGYFETENDPQPNLVSIPDPMVAGSIIDVPVGLFQHDYRQQFETIALGWQAREDLLIRLSYRGSQNELQTLNRFSDAFAPTGISFGTAKIDTDLNLLALNLEYEVNPWWSSRLTLGYYDETYSGNFDGSYGASSYSTSYDRATLSWANQLELSDSLNLEAGIDHARSDYQASNGRDIDHLTTGVYLNGTWTPSESLVLEAGLRYEDHNEFGSDLGWNIGFAYEFEKTGTRLRGRVAESYRTPTLLDSEAFNSGFGALQRATSTLDSEEILGFELGVEQEFAGQVVDLTYFQQQLDGAIVSGPITANGSGVSSYENVNTSGVSKVSGLELSSRGDVYGDALSYRLALTKQLKEEVLDVPDLQASLDLHYQANAWSAGAGVTFVDAANYAFSGTSDSYTTARVYGEYEVNDSVTLFGRVENILDRDYILSDDGFLPVSGQGRSFVIGATLKW